MVLPVLACAAISSVKRELSDIDDDANSSGGGTVIPVSYAVGKSTLQLSGVHLKVRGKGRAGEVGKGGKCVPFMAVVKILVHKPAAFITKATPTFSGEGKEGQGDWSEYSIATAVFNSGGVGNSVDSVAAAAAGGGDVFVKLDLRVQMERVKLVVNILPYHSPNNKNHKKKNNFSGGGKRPREEEEEGNSKHKHTNETLDCSLLVSVTGAISVLA